MRNRNLIAVLVVLALALAACAPAVRGSTAGAPLNVVPGETVELEQGQEVFLRYTLPLSHFDLAPSNLGGSFWIPAGVDAESTNLANSFTLNQVMAPANWQVELSQVRALRTASQSSGRNAGPVYEVTLTIRLAVAADAQLGMQTVRLELAPRSGSAQWLEIPVRVRMPAR